MKKALTLTISFILLVLLVSCDTQDTSTIICSNCNETISVDAKFCQTCGTSLDLGNSIPVNQIANSESHSDTEDKYKKANDLFSNKDYQAALIIFQELGDYEDSLEKIQMCEKQIGMSENADNDFLERIKESILHRMETNRKENVDYTTLVNTELAYVEQFQDKTFYDSELKALADKYIEGLIIQKDALKKEYIYEYQIDWQKGLVYRCEVLKALYDNYNFLTDNQDFIGTYISQYEDHSKLLTAYYKIEEDIGSQLNAEDFRWKLNNHNFYCTIKNDTDYEYSTTFVISFYDGDGIMYEYDEIYIENIKPGSSYVVSFYLEDSDRLEQFVWNNYYDDVKIYN